MVFNGAFDDNCKQGWIKSIHAKYNFVIRMLLTDPVFFRVFLLLRKTNSKLRCQDRQSPKLSPGIRVARGCLL
jgi:hypothetical protein